MRTTLLRLATTVLFLSLVSSGMGAGFAGLFVTRTEVTEVRICWNSALDRFYQLQHSSTLSGDDWSDLGSPVTGTGGSACVSAPVSAIRGFFRVRELGGETNGAGIYATIEISEVRMCWETATNLMYQLQYRSELTSNLWTDFRPPRAATDATTCDRLRVIDPRRSYRVVGPDVVWIPTGTFTMGSPPTEPARSSNEGPQTEVTISRGFWMGRYEVTQGEYLAVVGSNPSSFTGDLNRPVEQVSWQDAMNYCARLTERERLAGRLPEGYAYRLPTEAEWEYAGRAGTTTAFHYGNELRSGMANFYGWCEYPPCAADSYCCYNPSGIYLGRTTAVGSYVPNVWGLYDMHGNVWEWCFDWYGPYPGGSVADPTGPATGSLRVLRGGSWDVNPIHCRTASRYNLFYPSAGLNRIGFRSVLFPGQP